MDWLRSGAGGGPRGFFLIGRATLPAGVPRASAFLRPSPPLRACPGFSLVLTNNCFKSVVFFFTCIFLYVPSFFLRCTHFFKILLFNSTNPCMWYQVICQLVYMEKVSLIAQTVKRLPTVWETRVRSLHQEDPLEKEMATHSSMLAWKILWTEEPGRLQSVGSQRVEHDWATWLDFIWKSNIFPFLTHSSVPLN